MGPRTERSQDSARNSPARASLAARSIYKSTLRRFCYLIRSVFTVVSSLQYKWLLSVRCLQHTFPLVPPSGGFPKLKLCVKVPDYLWGVLGPLHQLTSWGEGAIFHPRQGSEAQTGADSWSQSIVELGPSRHLAWAASP